MFKVEISIGSGAKNLLEGQISEEVEQVYDNAMNRSILQLENIIKQPGYAPRATGHFAASHHANIEIKLMKTISNSLRVSNGEFLWKYIGGGHRTLTTPKSRRWWFAHLKEIGGNYERKTKGAVGYVPPNDYVNRAVTTLISSNFIDNVVKEEIGNLLSGSLSGPVSM